MGLLDLLPLDKRVKCDQLTVGISAYGNHVTTKACLTALFSAIRGEYELILVDDCSPDQGEILDVYRWAASQHPNTKIYRFDVNKEYSGSLNCILSHAAEENILFISNDIFVTPRYVATLFEVMRVNPEVGVVRGVSNFVDNGLSSHNLKCPELKSADDIKQFSEKVHKSEGVSFFAETFLTGDAFMVRKEVLRKIGTFDPLFFGYFADHDFGIRVCNAGYKLAVAKGAFAFHQQAANFDYLDEGAARDKVTIRWAKVNENWARFKMKYGFPVELLFPGMHRIDWEYLNAYKFDQSKYIPPMDYSQYVL